MSKYTTELRWVIENSLPSLLQSESVQAKIDYFLEHVTDYPNPFFNMTWRIPGADVSAMNAHKNELYKEFLHRYYFREIGFETYALWVDRLQEEWMHLARKYYPLWDADLQEVVQWYENYKRQRVRNLNATAHSEGETTGQGTASGSSSGTDWVLANDTPQGGLSWADIEGNLYLTNAQKTDRTGTTSNTTSNSGTNSSDGESTEAETETVTGFDGKPFIEVLTYYREHIFNTDNAFIDELEPMFMGVW